MKKLVSFLVILLCVAGFSACSEDEWGDNMDVPSISPVANVKELKADVQVEANSINAKILSNFNSSTRSTTELVYPEYYGGSYITPNGELIIFIKGDVNTGRQKISAISNDNKIIYQSCNYSYQELKDIVKSVSNYLGTNNLIVQKNVTGAALIDGENKVEVYLKKCDEQAIADFKRDVIDHPGISFLQSKEGHIESGTLYPGGMASINSTSTSYGSYGFRAVENSGSKRKGMVTAGHVVPTGGKIYNSGSEVGVCSISKQGGYADAAFVPTNSSFELSNYIVGTLNELSTETRLPGAGTYVNLKGATSGAQGSNIISTDAAEVFNGYVYSNLTTVNYTSDYGDSGGIIYTYISKEEKRYTVGIHLGKANGVKYFSKADYVLSTLNVSRY